MLFSDSKVERLARKRRFWFYVKASLLVVCVVVVSVAAGTAYMQADVTQNGQQYDLMLDALSFNKGICLSSLQ